MLPISTTRFLVMWVALAATMSANGIFRELVLKRFANGAAADAISATIGILIIGVITRIGFRPIHAATSHSLAFASAMLVLLTVAFETAIGVSIDHKSIGQLLEHYAIWRGELWPIVLAFLAFTPYLWARLLPTRGVKSM